MRTTLTGIIVMLFLIPGLSSCKRDLYRVNISSVSVDLEIERLEKDLFSIDPAEISSSIPYLMGKYGGFLQLFSYVTNSGDINDTSFADLLTGFCTDKLNYEVYQSVMDKYPDITTIEDDLEKAFRHYKWYFPDKKIPSVYTCITGFNNSLIIGDSVIGIGLERYLGSDCEYYHRLQIYRYIAARMNSWNIVPDCMYGWASSEWDYTSMGYPTDDVMSSIMHEGKLKYFQKCMMPAINDTILFGFSADQMKFCRNNERQMWFYLIEHDLLFSTDQFTISKLTGEAPFTTFFTGESPGRAAVWIGFGIIESYMMRNNRISLGEMMENTDIQGILEAAKYDPK
jgi:hypothetical protein